jgi:N-acetylglucosamine malate deacetylase 2
MVIKPRRLPEPIVRSVAHLAHAHAPEPRRALPQAREVLAVCAHPDDESFGLGAVLAAFSEQGARVRVLCFTHGEASTLGKTERSLGEVRARELRAAADVLGVTDVELLSYPDGQLEDVPLDELAGLVANAIAGADMLLVFDQDGVTGHHDHCRATEAALEAATKQHVPVLAWALPDHVASSLNGEFGTRFAGRALPDLDVTIEVNRKLQRAAIACHTTQSNDNPVLRRRLELLERSEHLRWLSCPPHFR